MAILDWLHHLSTAQAGLAVSGGLVGLVWLGLFLVRPFLRLAVRNEPDANDLVIGILSSHGVYYGILLGLLAVSAYQNFSDVTRTVNEEASSLAALYRDVSAFPEPERTTLRRQLRDYTRLLIDESWPEQRQGRIPAGETARITAFEEALVSFEPETKRHEIVLAESLSQFNEMVKFRRQRLNSIATGIPAWLWYIVLLGALINVILVWLLDMRFLAQAVLGGLLALFIGSVIALVVGLDHPFLGDVSIPPRPFENVYDGFVRQDAPAPAPGGAR